MLVEHSRQLRRAGRQAPGRGRRAAGGRSSTARPPSAKALRDACEQRPAPGALHVGGRGAAASSLPPEEMARLTPEAPQKPARPPPSRNGIARRCGGWSGRWCCNCSTRPGRTTCWRWTTSQQRRPARLRPGRSQGGIQARGDADLRADVGLGRRAVTDLVFRMEQLDEGFVGSTWTGDGGDPRGQPGRPATSPSSSRRPSRARRPTTSRSRSATASSAWAATILAPAAAARSSRTAACGSEEAVE